MNMTEIVKLALGMAENIVRKGKNAGYHVLLFIACASNKLKLLKGLKLHFRHCLIYCLNVFLVFPKTINLLPDAPILVSSNSKAYKRYDVKNKDKLGCNFRIE